MPSVSPPRSVPHTGVRRGARSAGHRWAVALCLGAALLPGTALQALELSDVAREGELRFLAERPDPGAYHYTSRVQISPDSLRTGVVELSTCHHQLDPNARIVIAFNPERVQDIRIAASDGIEKAWVDGHRVELQHVRRGASVCIDVRSRALAVVGENQWRLHAGPLMRRYLDGYLPMEARLAFEWPEGLLRVQQTQPPAQPGVQLTTGPAGAALNLVFAGRMTATVDLVRPGSP